MKLFTVAEMISAETTANDQGHSYANMMELAGKGAADVIQSRISDIEKNVLVLIGSGNNGGDGLVAARHLALAGADVACYLFKPRKPAQDNNLILAQAHGVRIIQPDQTDRLYERLSETDILIDALLGTGVSRPIVGELALVLEAVSIQLAAVNEQRNKGRTQVVAVSSPQLSAQTSSILKVAIDCPSGLNCDTGELDLLAISADLTVTFAGPKRGHFIFPGAAACGELVTVDIGINADVTAQLAVDVATAASVSQLLPARPLAGHKGTFGTALVVGGCAHYLGAPILSATAAYRSGAGVVALAVPHALRKLAATHVPEATFPIMADDERFSAESIPKLQDHLERSAALLVGPGLGGDSAQFLSALFSQKALPPLVVDADALNYLAQQESWWTLLPENSILTPHPGEMSRLVGHDSRGENRVALTLEMAQKWQQIVVLKGAYTVVAQPDGTAAVIPVATPALAVAGSGDVLAGTIVGLLAQNMLPYDAAVTGAYCHALAGRQLAQHNGSSGTLAGEIAHQLPQIMQSLRMLS